MNNTLEQGKLKHFYEISQWFNENIYIKLNIKIIYIHIIIRLKISLDYDIVIQKNIIVKLYLFNVLVDT